MKADKPNDWPINPYEAEIAKVSSKKKGGLFKVLIGSFKSTASGNPNQMLTLTLNKSIVDYRDQRILRYLKQKRNTGIDLNTLF